MTRKAAHRHVRPTVRSRPPQKERLHRLLFESLEDRTMLDTGGLPAAIVLGRTLATPSTAGTSTPAPSYFVGEVENNQVTITFTVYNEQADAETGILLTDTLEPGATFLSSSVTLDGTTMTQLPDQSGQNLAWSLTPITGYDRESVAVTVSLATPIPLQLDIGASVYAMLDAGAVSAVTPAAVLRAGNVPTDSNGISLLAPPLDQTDPLAAGSDANDPFIQEQAAKLDYDAVRIFDFLHDQIVYNSYFGSLRGARGTLWSMAGNAIDTANLGVALMRASGIPAQYVSGTLSQSQAQQLVLSMFPASYQSVGYIPAGTQVSDPANDPQLLSETESHYWFQFDTGSGMQDADPLMPGATIGQTFTTSTGTFTQIPDALRQKTEVQLVAETYDQVSGLFGPLLGGSGLTETTVLDKTFLDAELTGRPLTIGNFVSTSSFGALFLTSVTNTYSPYINVGDEAYPDGSHDQVLRGTDPTKSDYVDRKDYQELITNFPLGSQVLTGLFLNLTLSGPLGAQQTYERTLFDRIGFANREAGGMPAIAVDPSGPPAVSVADLYTVNVNAAAQDDAPAGPLQALLARQQASLAATSQVQASLSSASEVPLVSYLINLARSELIAFLTASDQQTSILADRAKVEAYYDQPRITIFSSGFDPVQKTFHLAIDLRRDSMRVIPLPGQSLLALPAFNLARGLVDNALEQEALPSGAGVVSIGTFAVFQTAVKQGVPFVSISSSNEQLIGTIDTSPDVKARMTAAISLGMQILVPARSVVIDGNPTISWLEINPATGEVSGVLPDGTRSNGDYAAVTTTDAVLIYQELEGGTLIISRVVTAPGLGPAFASSYPGHQDHDGNSSSPPPPLLTSWRC